MIFAEFFSQFWTNSHAILQERLSSHGATTLTIPLNNILDFESKSIWHVVNKKKYRPV